MYSAMSLMHGFHYPTHEKSCNIYISNYCDNQITEFGAQNATILKISSTA